MSSPPTAAPWRSPRRKMSGCMERQQGIKMGPALCYRSQRLGRRHSGEWTGRKRVPACMHAGRPSRAETPSVPSTRALLLPSHLILPSTVDLKPWFMYKNWEAQRPAVGHPRSYRAEPGLKSRCTSICGAPVPCYGSDYDET